MQLWSAWLSHIQGQIPLLMLKLCKVRWLCKSVVLHWSEHKWHIAFSFWACLAKWLGSLTCPLYYCWFLEPSPVLCIVWNNTQRCILGLLMWEMLESLYLTFQCWCYLKPNQIKKQLPSLSFIDVKSTCDINSATLL